MKPFGTFVSAHWGVITVLKGHYLSDFGPVAVVLEDSDGERLATLSVNMHEPDMGADSRDLPPNCFYAKEWSENQEIAKEALVSGLFKVREDKSRARSGFMTARAWEIVERTGT